MQPAESGMSPEGGGSSIANRRIYTLLHPFVEGRGGRLIFDILLGWIGDAYPGEGQRFWDDYNEEGLISILFFLSNPSTSPSSSF